MSSRNANVPASTGASLSIGRSLTICSVPGTATMWSSRISSAAECSTSYRSQAVSGSRHCIGNVRMKRFAVVDIPRYPALILICGVTVAGCKARTLCTLSALCVEVGISSRCICCHLHVRLVVDLSPPGVVIAAVRTTAQVNRLIRQRTSQTAYQWQSLVQTGESSGVCTQAVPKQQLCSIVHAQGRQAAIQLYNPFNACKSIVVSKCSGT